MINVAPNIKPTGIINFPDNMLPMTPAVRVYFAASAKILLITFRLSLFIAVFLVVPTFMVGNGVLRTPGGG